MARDEVLVGDGVAGDVCEYANGCQPGYVCWRSSRCAALCDTDADPLEPPECEFSLCGGHPGETGAEVCETIPEWESIRVGVCAL